MTSTKKKLLNKTIALGLSVALVSPFAVLSDYGIKKAAATTTAPTTGSIEFSLLDDDGKTFVSSDKVVFQNLSELTGGPVDYTTAWGYKDATTVSNNNGAALTKSSLKPGKYAVTAKVTGTVSVTSFVDVKASDKATKVKAIALPTSSSVDSKKSGKISGVVANGATVVIKNKTTAWKTVADTNGKFFVYVPAGTYNIIVDSDATKKNTLYSVKVQAGQNNLPIDDLADDNGANDALGYEVLNDRAGQSSINNISKEYKGKAIPNSVVRAYTVDAKGTAADTTDDVYTLIGETVTKKAAVGATLGEFSIKLKAAQPGKKIKIVIEDEAFNNSTTAAVYNLDKIDPTLVADSTAVVGKDVNIKFTDKSATLVTAPDLNVSLEGGLATTPVVLQKAQTVNKVTTGDYTISNGKITIRKESIKAKISDFTKDTDFTIAVTATGFVDTNVTQTIKAVAAPAISASVAKASTEGVKLTATKTTGSTNKIYYKISNASVDTPKLYSTFVSAGSTELTSSPKDNLTGVDATTNKYIAVYEVDDTQVVKFKLLTLTASNIKLVADTTAPTVSIPATTGTNNVGTKLVVTYGEALYNNGVAITDGADVKSLFTYDGTAANYTSATYDATNKTVTFVLTAGEDGKKLTTATAVKDGAGNAPASLVFTYATTGTIWSKN